MSCRRRRLSRQALVSLAMAVGGGGRWRAEPSEYLALGGLGGRSLGVANGLPDAILANGQGAKEAPNDIPTELAWERPVVGLALPGRCDNDAVSFSARLRSVPPSCEGGMEYIKLGVCFRSFESAVFCASLKYDPRRTLAL